MCGVVVVLFFFFQAEDGIRDLTVTGVQTCALPIVNIRAIASESKHDISFLRVVTSDVQTTQKALTNAGLKYELNDILNLELLDRPGELAKVAKRLSRAGINVHSIYILGSKNGRTEIALVVDDIERAKTAIK